MVIGACQAVGEVTNLALFKAFPPRVLACWGAGTGVAGLLGPATFLLMTSLQWSDSAKFVALIPTALAMHLLFRRLRHLATEQASQSPVLDDENRKLCEDTGSDHKELETHELTPAETAPLTANVPEGGPLENVPGRHTKSEPAPSLNMTSAAQIANSPVLARLILHCTAVYFLEYSIYPGFVDRDTHANEGASLLNRDAFILCWMAYNVGVSACVVPNE